MLHLSYKSKLGLLYAPKLNSLCTWLVVLFIIMGSIRGILVINFNIPPSIVYPIISFVLLTLSVYGYLKKDCFRRSQFVILRNLFKINLLLGVANSSVDLVLGIPFSPAVLYLYIAPYIVFVFLRVSTHYLKLVVIVVTIVIGYSVIDNFLISLSGPGGSERLIEYNLKLRPDSSGGLGTTAGTYFRVGGYTGNSHDAANILGMIVSFFCISFMLKRKFLHLGLCLFALIGLTMTQSATNIIAVMFTVSLFSMYLLVRKPNLSIYMYFVFAVLGGGVLIFLFWEIMTIFLSRIGPDGDWEGMTKQLGIDSMISALPYLLVGHAEGFESKSIHTEIALLGLFLQYGIFHTFIIIWLFWYPAYCYIKTRSICTEALPSLAAIFFCFMSLLHYASMFRVTSVFLFFVFYAICMNSIISCSDKSKLCRITMCKAGS